MDNYIERLLVKSDGIQILCELCHDAKSAVEAVLRSSNKRKKKRTKVKKRIVKLIK